MLTDEEILQAVITDEIVHEHNDNITFESNSMPMVTMKRMRESLKNVYLYLERCENIPPFVFHTLYYLENVTRAQDAVVKTKITHFSNNNARKM